MKVVVAVDSFKGSMTSMEAGTAVKSGILAAHPDAEVIVRPLADGGEGTTDALTEGLNGKRINLTVTGPMGEPVDAYYGYLEDTNTAVMEMASAAGITISDHADPMKATTFGVGEMILHAIDNGIRNFIIGIGGSATNDGGCGAAAAVGIRFYDRDGRQFIPTGGTTADIDRIDLSGRDSLLEQVEIVTMCDIDNPMYGPAGASFIFGPQKGADEAMVLQLDEGIRNLSRVIAQATGTDISQVPGTGAAGAMGAGMIAFFGSRLQMGIQTVLDTVRFDEIIGDADYILTGEGKLDSQSLRGKVVSGIAERANKQAKSVIAVVGGADDDEIGKAYDMGVTAVFPINRLPQDFSVSRHRSQENLAYTADNIIRLIKAGQGEH